MELAAAEASIKKLKSTPIPANSNIEKAAITAFGAAAAKSHVLSTHAEISCKSTAQTLIETQLALMEAKMKHFAVLESILEQERSEVEGERQRLFAERVLSKKGEAIEVVVEEGKGNGPVEGLQGKGSLINVE